MLGRYRGFQLGAAAGSNADLEQTYAYTSAGRFDSVTSSLSPSLSLPARTFQYSYEPTAALVHGYTTGANFAVTRSYDPDRDLLTAIETKWGTCYRFFCCRKICQIVLVGIFESGRTGIIFCHPIAALWS